MPRKIFYFMLSLFILPLPQVQAGQVILPVPGSMVQVSVPYNPPILKGIKVNPNDPFRLEFVLDQGAVETPFPPKADQPLADMASHTSLQDESKKLIKYFLASLTTPEKDLWVNLSPYEKDRIVPESFGQTEMGRDLLAQDYILKQLTASLIYPEGDIGKEFWKRVYQASGNKNIPINTFNKVWIVPNKAVVYENAKAGTAYVVESSLRVMLEQDYVAIKTNIINPTVETRFIASQTTNRTTQDITRDIVIPQLTKEVNEGANFAQLRQVYSSLILATWYKKKISAIGKSPSGGKGNIITQVYADKNKTKGTEFNDDLNAKVIYQKYLEAFKKGAYNYIKDEQDPMTKKMIPRKYFSGGVTFGDLAMSHSSNLPRVDGLSLILVSASLSTDSKEIENGAYFNVPLVPERIRLRPVLMQLASADSGKRLMTARESLQELNMDATQYTEILINNFIDPIGIVEAKKEFVSRVDLSAEKHFFNEAEARRNARSATLFALMIRIKTLRYNIEKYDDSRSKVALRKIQDVIVNTLINNHNNWQQGIVDEDRLVLGGRFLGHQGSDVPGKVAFLENLRLFTVSNNKVNERSFNRNYARWILRSIETILSFEVNDDQVDAWQKVWETVLVQDNQAMTADRKSAFQYWLSLKNVVQSLPVKVRPWVMIPYVEDLNSPKPTTRITQTFVMGFSMRTVDVLFSNEGILDLRIEDRNIIFNQDRKHNIFTKPGRSEQLFALMLIWLMNKEIFPDFKTLQITTVQPQGRKFFRRMVRKWRTQDADQKKIMVAHPSKYSGNILIQLDMLNLQKIKKSLVSPYVKPLGRQDQALLVASPTGGIDFNADHMNLEINASEDTFALTTNPALLAQLPHIDGLIPVVIDIKPLPLGHAGTQALQMFLGVRHD
jgi:hypothetical protein